VTIISDVIGADQIEAALRDRWPAVGLVDEPRPVTGGQWATIRRLRLTGTPHGVPGDLVLRIAPHAEMAAKEQAVQAAAADAGVATPRIHLTGPAGGPLRHAWALMDVAPGAPLLADLDGVAALARLPQIVGRLPHQLAGTMAAIHGIDPVPVVDRVRAAAPSIALAVDELWPHLRAGAEAAARPDLADAVERLAETQPPRDAPVVCHGDLHPLNLLADGPRLTILDWTGAIIAPAAFDVALTRLLLRHPPLPTPPALRPALGLGAAVLARRFTRLYQRANSTADLTHLDWYTALHAARILADHATWTRTGDPRARHHPWHLVAPGAATALTRATGIDIPHP
jgi:aminoglycoside phosphotransferase (APT) family kinase protein